MTELFNKVDAVLAKLVQYCVDHDLGYSYNMHDGFMHWYMKEPGTQLHYKIALSWDDLKEVDPQEIVDKVLVCWRRERLKR